MTPRKANAPVLTRPQIVTAAVRLVDRDGLAALSMRRLAGELGVAPMSLYHHVPDRAALEDLTFDAVMVEVRRPLSRGRGAGRPAGLRPAIGASCPPRHRSHHAEQVRAHTRQLRPVEIMLGILYEVGLSPTDAITAVDVVGQYVFGTTLAYVNDLARENPSPDVPETGGGIGIAPEDFPNLTRAIREAECIGWEEMFDRGLRALVGGLVRDRLDLPRVDPGAVSGSG